MRLRALRQLAVRSCARAANAGLRFFPRPGVCFISACFRENRHEFIPRCSQISAAECSATSAIASRQRSSGFRRLSLCRRQASNRARTAARPFPFRVPISRSSGQSRSARTVDASEPSVPQSYRKVTSDRPIRPPAIRLQMCQSRPSGVPTCSRAQSATYLHLFGPHSAC